MCILSRPIISTLRNYTDDTTTAETAREKIDGRLAEIHNIGLYSGADPIDIEFKQMPNDAANGGSYREVDNASDLSGLFSNLGKTASIGYARPSSSIDNSSFTFTSNVKYTGTLTIRGIQHEFTFTY